MFAAPLARDNVTYSESNTSSIAERVNRNNAAAGPHPNAKAGIIKYLNFVQVQNDTPSGPAVPTGNQSSVTAKNRIAMIQTQKIGAAWPTSAIVRLT